MEDREPALDQMPREPAQHRGGTPGALNNPVSTLHTRIDLILSRGAARVDGDEAVLIGDTPFNVEPPFWISDHAGVAAEVRLGR